MSNDWPFADPLNVATFTCREVVKRGQPVLWVSHNDDDGAWQFFGPGGVPDDPEEAQIVGLGEMVRMDPTLAELADLPLGWRAYRQARGQPWRRWRSPSDRTKGMPVEQVSGVLREVVHFIATKQFQRAVGRCSSSRVTASDLARTVAEYNATFVDLPKGAFEYLSANRVVVEAAPTWAVCLPLWSEEEGLSDLTLEATVTFEDGRPVVALDDIHVL